MNKAKIYIVAFDADCLLCQKSIQLLAQWDHSFCLRFRQISPEELAISDRLRVSCNEMIWEGASACITLAKALNLLPHWLIDLLSKLPEPLLDSVYDWIAARRLFWQSSHVCHLDETHEVKRRLIL